ncbi:MAG: TerB family tellurite resistance protein [Prevotella sp.]|nr:TerB family tellurite resistance protein [Prevotella sp.]
MTLNFRELAALVKMGVSMAVVDGKVEEVEKVAIAFELLKFGVSEREANKIIAESASMEASDALATLACMNDEQKKYATGYLAVIMASDSKIDDREVKLWQLICTLCCFPKMKAGEAVEFWKNN